MQTLLIIAYRLSIKFRIVFSLFFFASQALMACQFNDVSSALEACSAAIGPGGRACLVGDASWGKPLGGTGTSAGYVVSPTGTLSISFCPDSCVSGEIDSVTGQCVFSPPDTKSLAAIWSFFFSFTVGLWFVSKNAGILISFFRKN